MGPYLPAHSSKLNSGYLVRYVKHPAWPSIRFAASDDVQEYAPRIGQPFGPGGRRPVTESGGDLWRRMKTAATMTINEIKNPVGESATNAGIVKLYV